MTGLSINIFLSQKMEKFGLIIYCMLIYKKIRINIIEAISIIGTNSLIFKKNMTAHKFIHNILKNLIPQIK